ncbi:MAG: UbiX family flavin prenyltransferase [Legionellales bacterium]|nr:UbiX family flavin prenyltransferase [Legionellales bacterium]
METSTAKKLVIGMSGASGVIYGIRLLQILRELGIESHVIMSRNAEITLAYETSYKAHDVKALADVSYRINDLAATIASGSFRHDGMIIAPCSARLLCEIAAGTGDNLIARAADVTLKERRRLVLLLRETPLTLQHIRAMATVTEMGGIIAPVVPAFYIKPQSLDELVDHTVGRCLDLFDIDIGNVKRWKK